MVPGCRYSNPESSDRTSRRNAKRVYGHSGSTFHAFLSIRYRAISFSEIRKSGLIRGINLPEESMPEFLIRRGRSPRNTFISTDWASSSRL
jgi:hypothetical protein